MFRSNPANNTVANALNFAAPRVAQQQNALLQAYLGGSVGNGNPIGFSGGIGGADPVGVSGGTQPQAQSVGIGGGPGADPLGGYSTNIDFELDGKARPNKPNGQLLDVLGLAAEQALGRGARVVVYSGQEDPGNQHGSNRHKTGLAADLRVYRPDGTQVSLNDPDALKFATAAAQNGARGIGAGSEYMGNSFHVDMVPHNQYSAGQGPVWGSWAKQNRAQLLEAMGL